MRSERGRRGTLQTCRRSARRQVTPPGQRVGDVDGPGPTERTIEQDGCGQLPQLCLAQAQLGVEKAPLGVEDLDVARDTRAIAQLRELKCPPECLGLGLLGRHLVACGPHAHQRVARLPKRDEHTLLVLRASLVGAGARHPGLVDEAAAREERHGDPASAW